MTEGVRPEGEGWEHVDEVAEPTDPSVAVEDSVPAERWRRFTPPALIEDSLTDIVVEGHFKSRAADVTWPREVITKIRTGYQCLKCWEPQQDAFPENCPVCGYPMRENQATDFGREFHGDKWVGPTVSVDDEIESLAERSARRAHKPGSSIVVPGWAKT